MLYVYVRVYVLYLTNSVNTCPSGPCEKLGLITQSDGGGMLGNEVLHEVCRSSTVEFLTDFTATSLEQVLATAATKSMLTAQVPSLLAVLVLEYKY